MNQKIFIFRYLYLVCTVYKQETHTASEIQLHITVQTLYDGCTKTWPEFELSRKQIKKWWQYKKTSLISFSNVNVLNVLSFQAIFWNIKKKIFKRTISPYSEM